MPVPITLMSHKTLPEQAPGIFGMPDEIIVAEQVSQNEKIASLEENIGDALLQIYRNPNEKMARLAEAAQDIRAVVFETPKTVTADQLMRLKVMGYIHGDGAMISFTDSGVRLLQAKLFNQPNALLAQKKQDYKHPWLKAASTSGGYGKERFASVQTKKKVTFKGR